MTMSSWTPRILNIVAKRGVVLGPDHPDTLTTRNNVVYWTGRCGDVAEALRLATVLLPDRKGWICHSALHPGTIE